MILFHSTKIKFPLPVYSLLNIIYIIIEKHSINILILCNFLIFKRLQEKNTIKLHTIILIFHFIIDFFKN